MKKDHRGVSALEGLLVLVIIGLVAFVAWFVWHSHAKTATNPSAYAPPAAPNVKSESKKPKGVKWLTYTNSEHHYSFRYPSLIADDCRDYFKGKVIEDGDTVYVTSEKYGTCDNSGKGKPTTLAMIKANEGPINFIPVTVKPVLSETQIGPVVNSVSRSLGDDCTLYDSIKKSSKGDWYDVSIKNGKDCSREWTRTMRYYKSKQHYVDIELGLGPPHFADQNDDQVSYDKDFVNSFHFVRH